MAVGDYVTATGLVIPTVQGLLDTLTAEQRRDIDAGLDTSPESPQGQFNGNFASHDREAWELAQIAYDAFDPDSAEGSRLDAVCRITGTTRAAATPSRFLGPARIKVTLAATMTLNAGTLFSQAGSEGTVVFETTENVDSTAAGDYFVSAQCTRVGPVSCAAGTLTVIQTPVVGLSAVTNPTDAILGTAADTDARLRLRRVQELALGEGGSVAAINAALLAYTTTDLVHPILEAVTYENTTDFFDADGRPPHSTEALIFDGDIPAVSNDDVAKIIWANRGGGIQSFGNTSGVTPDYRGVSRTVRFSRPTISDLTISQTIVYDASQAAPDPVATKQTLVDRFNASKGSKLGDILCRWDIFVAAVKDDVPNALGTTTIALGTVSGGPLTPFTNLNIPSRTKLRLTTSHITLTLNPGTP